MILRDGRRALQKEKARLITLQYDRVFEHTDLDTYLFACRTKGFEKDSAVVLGDDGNGAGAVEEVGRVRGGESPSGGSSERQEEERRNERECVHCVSVMWVLGEEEEGHGVSHTPATRLGG